jgi:hypothetical protein
MHAKRILYNLALSHITIIRLQSPVSRLWLLYHRSRRLRLNRLRPCHLDGPNIKHLQACTQYT